MADEKKSDKHIPLVGYVLKDVGRSAWDFYSWGHIDMGIMSFLIFSLFITVTQWMDPTAVIWLPWWSLMVMVLIFAVAWEIIENTILWQMGKKFENRKDSIYNSIWDIIFVMGGGFLMWLFKWIIMDLLGKAGRWYYLVGFISFGIVLLFYFIGYFITSDQTQKMNTPQIPEERKDKVKKCPTCGKNLINLGSGSYQCPKCNKIISVD